MKKFYLVLNRCIHDKKYLSIDDDSGGIRITTGKCCGRVQVEEKWLMTISELKNAIIEFKSAICDMEQNE